MVKPIIPKADWDQHVKLAHYLHGKGLTSTTTMAWFKSQNYVVKGAKFEATRVSAVIAGIEIASPAEQYTLDDMVAHINTAITSGELKYTKVKQVHHVPVKPVATVTEVEIDGVF